MTTTRIERRMRRRVALVAATLLPLAAAHAAMPREGAYDQTNCWSGQANVIAFSKTHVATTGELIGTSSSNPPGGPFDKMTYRCVTQDLTIEGKTAGTYYCEAVDPEGDKLMIKGTYEGPKGRNEVLAGTGKYDGLVRVGTSESNGVFPTVKPGAFSGCHRQTGTYRLKAAP